MCPACYVSVRMGRGFYSTEYAAHASQPFFQVVSNLMTGILVSGWPADTQDPHPRHEDFAFVHVLIYWNWSLRLSCII